MNIHFHASSATRSVDRAPRSDLVRTARNSNIGRSNEASGQSPFSPLFCVLLLVAAGMLVKFGPALQSLHLIH